MQFHEFKVGQVVNYPQKNVVQKLYRGVVVEKTVTFFKVLWAVTENPELVVYTISDEILYSKMTFYANWCDFNTVPVHTHNTLNKF